MVSNVAIKTMDNAVFDEEVVEIEGNAYRIQAFNPHGFYRVQIDKGRLPDLLKGSYTTKTAAEADIRKYLAEKSKAVVN